MNRRYLRKNISLKSLKVTPTNRVIPQQIRSGNLPICKNKRFVQNREHGYCAKIYISIDGTIVVKKNFRYMDWDIHEREVFWLKKLAKFSWCPTLIEEKKPFIATSFCGQQLTAKNRPSNWKAQITQIIKDLHSVNCRHNDFKAANILVDQHGKISLIDFAWASLGDDFSCGIGIDNRETVKTLTEIYQNKSEPVS